LVTETKTPRDIVHDEQPSNLCDSANFLWNSRNRPEKCVHKLGRKTVLGWWRSVANTTSDNAKRIELSLSSTTF
jgi:hypothetical protein